MRLHSGFNILLIVKLLFLISCGNSVDEADENINREDYLDNTKKLSITSPSQTKETISEYSWDNVVDFYSKLYDFNLNLEHSVNTKDFSKSTTSLFSVQNKEPSQIVFNTSFSKVNSASTSDNIKTITDQDMLLWANWISFIHKYPELFHTTKSQITLDNNTYETITFNDLPANIVLLFMRMFYFSDKIFGDIQEQALWQDILSSNVSEQLVFNFILADITNTKVSYSCSSIEQEYLLKEKEHKLTREDFQKNLNEFFQKNLEEKSQQIQKNLISQAQEKIKTFKKELVANQLKACNGLIRSMTFHRSTIGGSSSTHGDGCVDIDQSFSGLLQKAQDPDFSLNAEVYNQVRNIPSEFHDNYTKDCKVVSKDSPLNVEEELSKIQYNELDEYQLYIEQNSNSGKNINPYGIPYKSSITILKDNLIPIEMSIQANYDSQYVPKLKISVSK